MKPDPVPLACLRGNATLFPGVLWADGERHPLVLTGKRKRPDSLHWSLGGERDGEPMAVNVMGLGGMKRTSRFPAGGNVLSSRSGRLLTSR